MLNYFCDVQNMHLTYCVSKINVPFEKMGNSYIKGTLKKHREAKTK